MLRVGPPDKGAPITGIAFAAPFANAFCQACAEVSCYLLHRRIEDSFGECLLWELLRNICGDHRGDLGDALLSDHDAEQDADEECENALGRFIEFFVLAVK